MHEIMNGKKIEHMWKWWSKIYTICVLACMNPCWFMKEQECKFNSSVKNAKFATRKLQGVFSDRKLEKQTRINMLLLMRIEVWWLFFHLLLPPSSCLSWFSQKFQNSSLALDKKSAFLFSFFIYTPPQETVRACSDIFFWSISVTG